MLPKELRDTKRFWLVVCRLRAPLLAVAVLLASGLSANAQARSACRIADPTSTPLNVRTTPNGRIVGALENGISVTILEQKSSKGQAWVYVGNADTRSPIGWVFRDYVRCQPEATLVRTATCRVFDPTSTPLNVRTAPNGRVVGNLQNGLVVRILDERTENEGQAWVYVGNPENGMPIGWVFRNYLDCGLGYANAPSSNAPRQIDPANDDGPSSITVECAVVRVIPEDKDPNRGYKVLVSTNIENGILRDMSVIHTRLNGLQADRATQYSGRRFNQRGDTATWIGSRGPLTMNGVLDPIKMTYNEYITRDGRLETQIETKCHYLEGD
jgi:hypothetical protein